MITGRATSPYFFIGGDNMKVKCRYCGEYIEKNIAYKDPARRNFYYCNEKEAQTQEAERQERIEKENRIKEEKRQKRIDPVYEEVADIFGYRIGNGILFEEMKIWRGICNDEKILAYLQENKDYIKSKIEQTNSSEYARIRYMSAILKNNLHDYKVEKKVEPTKITVDYEMYEPVHSTKKRRRSLSELEDEVI